MARHTIKDVCDLLKDNNVCLCNFNLSGIRCGNEDTGKCCVLTKEQYYERIIRALRKKH